MASTLATSGQKWYICSIKDILMEVKVLFFGVLGERAGCSEKSYSGVTDTDSLEKIVAMDIPGLTDFSYRVSLNKSLIISNSPLHNGDEVAFLPPFAGG
jgi:sulfur-carrier protein